MYKLAISHIFLLHLPLLIAIAVLFGGCASSSSDEDDSPTDTNEDSVVNSTPLVRITSSTDRNSVLLEVELARTSEEQMRGLMFRNSLDEFAGMLFLFADEQERFFTMENTFIPLDMIHIDSTFRVVGIVENATPETAGPYSVGVPAEYVLEVNGGFAERHNIRIGDRVVFSGF